MRSRANISIPRYVDLHHYKEEVCSYMMSNYELSTNKYFDYIIRLRPDIMYLKALKHPSLYNMKLNYGNIVLPNKLWKPGPNDHFGICKGSASGVSPLPTPRTD